MKWFDDIGLQLPIANPTWIFFLVLTIILIAPIFLSKFRIPHIIGMILAGMVIGEHGFNILERDSSFELFSKVGVYYIMFLAGLEMNLEDFKQNRFKALTFAFYTFFIPALLGLWTSRILLDYNLATSLLLASLYGSHTLIAYPVISRYGLSRLRSISITVGGTAIAVILSLLMLAIIVGHYRGEVTQMFWIMMFLKIAIVFFLIVFFFPRIGRWFFRKYEDNITQFIFVLAMVFLSGGMFELAGLEGILGAFLAGLVLNRLIPTLSPLMNRLEFVGNAIFIPYFLIGVGMLIDVHAIFIGGETLRVALVMTVVATISKWLSAWLTQKTFRMNADERSIIFGLSNAHAAAALAAVLIGNKVEISPGVPLLNDAILNGAIVMILFSCLISSIVTERAAHKVIVRENLEGQENGIKEEENILIPIADSDTMDNLVKTALLVKAPKRKEGMIALRVMNDNTSSETQRAQSKRDLGQAVQIAAATDVMMHTVTRFDLNVASGIIHTLKEYNASEIIIGLHHKTTMVDSFWGTIAENLLKGTYRQIMIIKYLIPPNTLRRMIVAVPPKAEYEVGFFKWVERLCRMGTRLGCRVHFFAPPNTWRYIQGYIDEKHRTLRFGYTELEDWDDLPSLTKHVNYDHLLVIVTARRGFVSYQPSFERLSSQISRHFAENSLVIVYPDQHGDPQEISSFSEPRHHNESQQHYGSMLNRIYKWFKKN
ncbi:Na(+)/H(+)-K(+) antiporter GerN [termite gut metagenome]|uniref:Na(+)/H(+)-K(+) antiporter GerN n=1 Tax=termite gut metagenome TaxID=433724 RepID=A0A5J4T3C3_9ZZZZ